MFTEILFCLSLISLIVFAIGYCRKLIKRKASPYKGYGLRERVYLKLWHKRRSCGKVYGNCTDCPNFGDCVMRAIRDAMNDINEELKNERREN